jgi:hypothetical protein
MRDINDGGLAGTRERCDLKGSRWVGAVRILPDRALIVL